MPEYTDHKPSLRDELHAELERAQRQVQANREYRSRDPFGRRHESHDDYAEGVEAGLQKACDLLVKWEPTT